MAEAKSHAVFRPGLLSADKQNQFSELQVSIAKLKVRGDAAACSFTVSPCCERISLHQDAACLFTVYPRYVVGLELQSTAVTKPFVL